MGSPDPQFLVIEGADGTGTTTVSKLLTKRLNNGGVEAMWTKEPSEGTIGRHIRRILKGEELADELSMFPLFLADRHDHIHNTIMPELKRGVTVVCDRYYPSTWVYQQDNYPAEVIEFMQSVCLAPHWLFILTASLAVAKQRMKKRAGVVERYDDAKQQQTYADRYRAFSRPIDYEMQHTGAVFHHGRRRLVPTIGDEKVVHIHTDDSSPEDIVKYILEQMGLMSLSDYR